MFTESKLIQQIRSQVATLAQAVVDAQFWHAQWLVQAKEIHQKKIAVAETNYQQTLNKVLSVYEQQIRQAKHIQENQIAKSKANCQQSILNIQSSYKLEMEEIKEKTRLFRSIQDHWALMWDHEGWKTWTPQTDGSAPPLIRLGQLIEKSAWETLNLPALLPFIGKRSLLFKVRGTERHQAVQATHSLLLRLLATTPPGKLLFTFIDPVGLGRNVAPFMHLEEYGKELINSRAWTEPQHIEQILSDLTTHIEDVNRQRLLNIYTTLEQYNEDAGEIREPYRVLVVHDFPTNFSETSARRLVSIIENGARCGVYAIIIIDPEKPSPYGFKLADLENHTTVITHKEETFFWEDSDSEYEKEGSFQKCILELDTPPDTKLFNWIVEQVGLAARNASQVQVPFADIIPSPEKWWSTAKQTLNGLHIALGPAGARRLQFLDLGQNMAIHALVAGRTGSGKSTLLNAIIINLALTYHPDELELYLIDFKKGVEFKPYADYQLPHAKVIAIEGEREFGLSVLQGLNDECTRRSTLIKATGGGDLKSYREKTGKHLPRILLLVDEFQIFFIENDLITAECAKILGTLVAQGREFGIHVLLSSQTLATTRSLMHSTFDQMAVRIALQCSMADSQLILADDNSAARRLTRPGQAIYNDSNGLLASNKEFQVAWLPDSKREEYLKQLHELATKLKYKRTQPQIVFEGNTLACIEKNHLLNDILSSSYNTVEHLHRGMFAWLGDPIAIREPVAAIFRKQSGSNLLIVGQSEESAFGMLAASLISLAVQLSATGTSFYVLDFNAVDNVYADYLNQLKNNLPHTIQLGRRRQLADFLSILADKVQRRIDNEGEPRLPIFLFIHGLQRARDLRNDDGIGYFYNSSNESQSPTLSQQLARILCDGPEVDVHTLVWCDTVTNLNRTLFDRRTLREFALRVVMHMPERDSVELIETTLANRLVSHRALFYNEDEGRLEKFRPYGLPAATWLQAIGKQIK